MREIGSGSGVVIIEEGQRLHIVDRETGGMATAIFVFSLITGICGLAGVALTIKLIADGGSQVGFGLTPLSIGVLGGLVLWQLIRAYRQRKQRGLGEARGLVLIDLAAGQLCDPQGAPLAPLAQVRFRRRFQVTSSSKALEVVFPGGSIEIAAGNPFAGGLGNLEAALAQRGLNVG